MTFTFDVPVAKCDNATLRVTLDDAGLREMAAHGLKQRINDATAGVKFSDFHMDGERRRTESEVLEAYHDEAWARASKVAARINAGEFGKRVSADPKKAAIVRGINEVLAQGVTLDDIIKAAIAQAEARKAAA